MVFVDDINFTSQFPAKLAGGEAAELPVAPRGIFDAWFAADTQNLYISSDGLNWDLIYPMGNLNTGVPDVRCRLRKTGTQSLSSSSAADVLWDAESYDTDSMHSTGSNTERIVINTKGIYTVHANIRMNTTFDNGTIRASLIHHDDSAALNLTVAQQTAYEPAGGTGVQPGVCLSTELELDVNDYLLVNAIQTTSSSEDISSTGTFFTARLVRVTP